MKNAYLVIACPRCQGFLLAKQGRKTRQCPYCGKKMELSKTEVLWVTSDLEEARSMLHSKRRDRPEPMTASEYRKRISTDF